MFLGSLNCIVNQLIAAMQRSHHTIPQQRSKTCFSWKCQWLLRTVDSLWRRCFVSVCRVFIDNDKALSCQLLNQMAIHSLFVTASELYDVLVFWLLRFCFCRRYRFIVNKRCWFATMLKTLQNILKMISCRHWHIHVYTSVGEIRSYINICLR